MLALVSQPELLDDSRYPEDAKERARTILDGCRGGSVGKYNFIKYRVIMVYVISCIVV